MPPWVTEARSLSVIESTGRAIISLLPDNPTSIFSGDRVELQLDHGKVVNDYALKMREAESYRTM
jgi:hypothetical protein